MKLTSCALHSQGKRIASSENMSSEATAPARPNQDKVKQGLRTTKVIVVAGVVEVGEEGSGVVVVVEMEGVEGAEQPAEVALATVEAGTEYSRTGTRRAGGTIIESADTIRK